MNLHAYIKKCFVRQIKLSISAQYEVQKIMKVMIMTFRIWDYSTAVRCRWVYVYAHVRSCMFLVTEHMTAQ